MRPFPLRIRVRYYPLRSWVMKAIVSCNTSAGPYFVATAQNPSWNPLNIPQFRPLLEPQCAQNFSASNPPNFKCTMQLWWAILVYLMSSVASPTFGRSPAMISWGQQNVSSLRIFYNGTNNLPDNSYRSKWYGSQYSCQRLLVSVIWIYNWKWNKRTNHWHCLSTRWVPSISANYSERS